MARKHILPVVCMALLASATALGADAFKAQRERYLKYLERPSLYMRHRGRVEFAATHDARALALLAKSYARPEDPKEQVRALLVSICCEQYDAPEYAPALAAWRKKHTKPQDAWLWYRTLTIERKHTGAAELIDTVHSRREGTLRSAALLALAEGGDESTLPVLTRLLGELPAQPFDRTVLLEAAAEALWLERGKIRQPAWREAAALLIPQLEERGTPERTKLVIARRLAEIWNTNERPRTAAPWLARLEGRKPEAHAAETKPPFFLGIAGTGRRVAYVIDLSDSMLTPLTGREIENLQKTPAAPPEAPLPAPVVTGGKDEPGVPAPPRMPDASPPADPVAQLPWPSIKTRFDAARAFLTVSLRALHEDVRFCVIGFGTEARLLAATPGLRPATAANIQEAIEELEAIRPGPKATGRPYGTLEGYTNLHGGLRRAFLVRETGLAKEHADVDPSTFEDGCDTVFVLSDGKPTWDDWPTKDTLDAEDKPGDPESGATTKDSKTATFYGPYAIASWLLEDLRRLDLLRHAEIHCVGLGEYDPALLDVIRRIGKGQFRRIGGS